MVPSEDKSYLDSLNDVQRDAVVNTEGPVLVVAGPGSGKTRVLTFRIAHLIEKGVKPWEILTLTFTNKAAKEMKERIEKVVGSKANYVWAGTFHSIFAKILRVEGEKIGYPANFTIYDSDDSKNVIKAIIRENNFNKDIYNVNTIRQRISMAKSKLITPTLYAQNSELIQQDKLAKRPFTGAIYEKYTARCKRAGAMDFDDLLYRLYELFHKNPDNVLQKYRDRFKYVLVDEFQDTNHLQYEIVKKLVHYQGSARNISVVGDDAQSIYAFRGATIQNILDYEADFKPHGIKVFKLEQNYRSTDHIVQAANEVINYNKHQIPKSIWSDKGVGEKVKVVKALADTEEGKRVADLVLEQKNRHHLSNKDIAILYRTNSQSRIFEEYLRRYNIHYKVFGGLSFYQRKEVKDMIAYFRIAANQNDEEAFRRVINYPKRGIGAASVDKISLAADKNNMTMYQVLPHMNLATRTKTNIIKFMKIVDKLKKAAKTENAYEVAKLAAKESGIVDLLKNDTTVEGLGRMENLQALLDGIKEFVENDEVVEANEEAGVEATDKSMASYLQNIALLTDADKNSETEDYVTLMSVHAAKGLEFKSVFVVGLEEKLFPSFMSIDSPEGLDEERRLFYVAITRAEQFLTLSYAKSRYKFGQMKYNEPSRFLTEINPIHLEAMGTHGSGEKIQKGRQGSFGSANAGPTKGGVSGNFRKRTTAANATLRADPKTFKPSPSSSIQTGMKVLHLKFGEGKVISVDGGASRVATIHFKSIDNPERRIMLKFAKLQILD